MVLFRIMIPVLIIVKLLESAGAISVLGRVLAPVMSLVGLPGSMGLVWAAAMITSLYGGIAVFLTLAPAAGLSSATSSKNRRKRPASHSGGRPSNASRSHTSTG